MPIVVGAPRLLVKSSQNLTDAPLALGPANASFTAERLFASIRPTGRGLAAASTWHLLTPTASFDQMNAWDICHALMTGGLGIAGAALPDFVEPDHVHSWVLDRDAGSPLMLAGGCADSKPPDARFPTGGSNYWFRDPAHGQFDATIGLIGDPGTERVRVAHLDTGYDPEHTARPKYVNETLQRNFVDADRANDARDVSEGPFNNRGHGTGTLGVLAGQGIGAAPFVEVVPIRVANSVVQFATSSIARAFDYIHSLSGQRDTQVHVITMSIGGVASQAWAEAVNALYDVGIFVVTAAGNNIGNLPTHNIVFPARFRRVVAACGVMSDNRPYADLGFGIMAGDYGPMPKMQTAIAGFTPNIPWARLGCPDLVDLAGSGTSCATPQVAAAAATWIQRYKTELANIGDGWKRVEAVRTALFETANDIDTAHLGHGRLRARDALDRTPAGLNLQREDPDSAQFPILRLFFGQGLAEPSPRQRMLELEALQLSQSTEVEAVLGSIEPDPWADPQSVSRKDLERLAEVLAAQQGASTALRIALGRGGRRPQFAVLPIAISDPVQKLHLKHATDPEPPKPSVRRLRVYAQDPSLGARLETLAINEAALDVRWEQELEPGPKGEYVEVIDVDPPTQCCYAPVDLNHPHLLVQDGLPPSESNPQFQQQMAYAVAMKTIEHFERALGRAALWSPRLLRDDAGKITGEEFVQRLRIYPHALRAANAFYSTERKALLLGYFTATEATTTDVPPETLVFGSLSHDVIAHETTHALLDGLHVRFQEPTNEDVLAFHEAFADIVALFQHFAIPEALRETIARTRGDLGKENLLAQLAVEFGRATGRKEGLRNAIGRYVDGRWTATPASPDALKGVTEPHARGAVLVAAVFDAFLKIYRVRTADLVRLATQGTGVLPEGDIPVDLVERLAGEASKVATHVLSICIRALDYCPPVDIKFGEYLRALITADRDLVPRDDRGYRVAFVSAFRDRGIYPAEVRNVSEGSLVWEPPPMPLQQESIERLVSQLSLGWDLTTNRYKAYLLSRENRIKMQRWLMNRAEVSDEEIAALGFSRGRRPTRMPVPGRLGRIEVHSLRPARRVGPDGHIQSDLVVEITQTFNAQQGSPFRGGCTLLIDLNRNEVRYFIRKRVDSVARFEDQQAFAMKTADDLRATYFAHPERGVEPFALLHRGY